MLETIEELTVPFKSVTAISRHNPRHDHPDADIEEMEASIADKGILHKIIVHADPLAPQNYHVLSGGRRWRGLQLALKNGRHRLVDGLLPVVVARASDARLRDIALASNFHHRVMHPVDEFEAFAKLKDLGAEKIAAAYGLGLRQVKQRLALGDMHPDIRVAWREGRIDGDQAKAIAATGDHDAQALLLEELAAPGRPVTKTPVEIRRLATEGAMAADCAEALFVGAGDYLAAGGAIDEDLFTEKSMWRDGTLLRRLAADKLAARGRAVIEKESWGHLYFGTDKTRPGKYELRGSKTHEKAIAELEKKIESTSDRVQVEDLIADQDDIWSKVYRGALSIVQRKKLGIAITLDNEGFVSIERGVELVAPVKAKPIEEEPAPSAKPKKSKAKETPAPTPAAPIEREDDPPALRQTIIRALEIAVRRATCERPDLAMMLATATIFRANIAFDPFDSSVAPRGNSLLRAASRAGEGLAILSDLAAAPLTDLAGAFAYTIGNSFEPTLTTSNDDLGFIVRSLQMRGADLAPRIAEVFDYDAYFRAAAKEPALAVIVVYESHDAGKEATKLTKRKLQTRAAEVARANAWLPMPLAEWVQTPVAVEQGQWFTLPADDIAEAAE